MAQTALGLDSLSEGFEQTSLNERLAGTCIHPVCGVELITDCAGVAYVPSHDALLVADLHLEKGSSIAKRGQLIPPYDTQTTLNRLADCLEFWRPASVFALGDSFHDNDASDRLESVAHRHLSEMMQDRQWVWIAGNHDDEPPRNLGGDVATHVELGPLFLTHEPRVNGPKGEIAGHLHPKAKLVRRGRRVVRSCFAASSDRMILPSFGAYTGGLNVFHSAFDGLFHGRNFHAMMRGEKAVYRIAASELR